MIVMKSATQDTRAKIEDGNLKSVLKSPWIDALVCSDRMLDFYEDVYEKIDETPSIRIGTTHASKGMEADNIYLDLTTTTRVDESAELDPDSEIRVRYVGITRARHNLTLMGDNHG